MQYDEIDLDTADRPAQWLTVTQAAMRFGGVRHRRYILAEIARGNLEARRAGNQWMITEDNFDLWLSNPRRRTRLKAR